MRDDWSEVLKDVGAPSDATNATRRRAWEQVPRQLQVSHLVAAALSAACLFSVGVYFLRQVPVGPTGPAAETVRQVQLVSLPASVQSQPVAPPVPTIAPTVPHIPVPLPAPPDAAQSRSDLLETTARAPTPAMEMPTTVSVAALEAPPSAMEIRAASSSAAIDFQSTLFAHVERYRHYPDAALPSRLHGVVQLLFAMDRGGAVLGVWVRRSSGSPVLDQEAEDTIRRAAPMPPIPPALPGRIEVLLPVEFSAP